VKQRWVNRSRSGTNPSLHERFGDFSLAEKASRDDYRAAIIRRKQDQCESALLSTVSGLALKIVGEKQKLFWEMELEWQP
jgi:hypothetical protein